MVWVRGWSIPPCLNMLKQLCKNFFWFPFQENQLVEQILPPTPGCQIPAAPKNGSLSRGTDGGWDPTPGGFCADPSVPCSGCQGEPQALPSLTHTTSKLRVWNSALYNTQHTYAYTYIHTHSTVRHSNLLLGPQGNHG